MNHYKMEEKEFIITAIKTPVFNKLLFYTDEIIIKSGKLEIKMPKFWNLENIDILVFNLNGKKYTYIREVTECKKDTY